jgi:hypothetical protein
MKRTATASRIALAALASLAIVSCSSPATDAQIAEAYNFYLESPNRLSKMLSSATTDKIIDETVASEDETCVRKTEINQASSTSKITVTFKDYKPRKGTSVAMNGQLVISSLGNVFAINGSIDYKGFVPARLTFRNATLTQRIDENGDPSFIAKEGTILADKREIGVDEFFNKIMR